MQIIQLPNQNIYIL